MRLQDLRCRGTVPLLILVLVSTGYGTTLEEWGVFIAHLSRSVNGLDSNATYIHACINMQCTWQSLHKTTRNRSRLARIWYCDGISHELPRPSKTSQRNEAPAVTDGDGLWPRSSGWDGCSTKLPIPCCDCKIKMSLCELPVSLSMAQCQQRHVFLWLFTDQTI